MADKPERQPQLSRFMRASGASTAASEQGQIAVGQVRLQNVSPRVTA